MAIVHSMDEGITTVVADTGNGLIAIWVEDSRGVVNKALGDGHAVTGDSALGEVSVFREVVKYTQAGQREVNFAAKNRPVQDVGAVG